MLQIFMKGVTVGVAQPSLFPSSTSNIVYSIGTHRTLGIGIYITDILKGNDFRQSDGLVNLGPKRAETFSELFQSLDGVHGFSDVVLTVLQLNEKQTDGHSTRPVIKKREQNALCILFMAKRFFASFL